MIKCQPRMQGQRQHPKHWMVRVSVFIFIDTFPVTIFFKIRFRQGSVIANFTIWYQGFDSYQFVLLQDVIEVDRSINKLDLMPYPTQFQLGPNGKLRVFIHSFIHLFIRLFIRLLTY